MRARRRRSAVLGFAAITLVLLVLGLVRGLHQDPQGSPASAWASSRAAAGSAGHARPVPSATPGGPVDEKVTKSGDGRFTTAPGAGSRAGQGTILRYEVQVEDGSGLRAGPVASFVEQTLADPRSWIATKKWGFQRISSGKADFTIKLSSPDTVDKLCAPLTTDGYTSCRKGNTVVINTDRWTNAVKAFNGAYLTYRHYVINHEVGHRLGRGHMGCPGKGQLAPVMMQQTYGLRGCRINGWPYVDGRFVKGPAIAGS